MYAQAGPDEITPADLEAAADLRRRVAGELEETTARYEENLHRSDELQYLLSALAVELTVQERELSTARIEARDVARELYMAVSSDGLMVLLESASFTELSVRQGYMDLASANDVAVLNHLMAVEASYLNQQLVLEEAFAEQEQVTVEIAVLAAAILDRLEEADAGHHALVSNYQAQEAEKARIAEEERIRREEEERRRQEEEERRREAEAAAIAAAAAATTTTTAAPAPVPTTTSTTSTTTSTTSTTTTQAPSPTTTTTVPPPLPAIEGSVCPIDGGTSFVDTWGASRSGGRTHKGVDMYAARGTPVVAIESGKVLKLRTGGLGGIAIWLRGGGGDEYYYAHLDAWADGLIAGQFVQAGELIGYVGKHRQRSGLVAPTCTSSTTRAAGAAVNPYPLAAELCL